MPAFYCNRKTQDNCPGGDADGFRKCHDGSSDHQQPSINTGIANPQKKQCRKATSVPL